MSGLSQPLSAAFGEKLDVKLSPSLRTVLESGSRCSGRGLPGLEDSEAEGDALMYGYNLFGVFSDPEVTGLRTVLLTVTPG